MNSVLRMYYQINKLCITRNEKGLSSPPPSTILKAHEFNIRGLFLSPTFYLPSTIHPPKEVSHAR